MKLFAVAGLVLLTMALSGCVGTTQVAPAPTPTASASDAPTPVPEPTPNLVDPADFATSLRPNGESIRGIDFSSPDGNVSCGIFDWFSPVGVPLDDLGDSVTSTGGCVALYYDYEFPRPADLNENIGCDGAFVTDVSGPALVCNNGQVFLRDGDTYQDAIVRVAPLPVGSAIVLYGITCESLDPATVRCENDMTGHGFVISQSEYREF